MIKKWKDNAFWDNDDKTRIKAIMELEIADGTVTTQVVTINRIDPASGLINPDWESLLEQLGEDLITSNTEERIEKKQKEAEVARIKEQELKKGKALAALFNAKLEAFEIDDIKESNNRALKTKLRRAKSLIEVNAYTTMIIMEQMNESSGEN